MPFDRAPLPSVSRRVLLRGLGALSLGAGLSHVASTVAPAKASATGSNLLFDADFSGSGFSRYRTVFPDELRLGIDYGTCPDPTGIDRQVAFFDNFRAFSLPGTAARSAAETPRLILPKAHGNTVDEYWVGASLFVPSSRAPEESDDWLTVLAPAYGAPFGGPSPLRIGLRRYSKSSVRVQLSGDSRLLGKDFVMPLDTWFRIVMNFRFAYNGWVRIWAGTGPYGAPTQRVLIRGKSTYSMQTMARGVNDAWYQDPRKAANSSRVCAYGAITRIYVGHHKLAAAPASTRTVSI